MKLTIPLLFILLASCASNNPQNKPFYKREVCSENSLDYLSKHQGRDSSQLPLEEVQHRMQSIVPALKQCFNENLERTQERSDFQACLVVGYDSKGVQEYFEISSKKEVLSQEFKDCMEKVKSSPTLVGLKDISIIQPFAFYPDN